MCILGSRDPVSCARFLQTRVMISMTTEDGRKGLGGDSLYNSRVRLRNRILYVLLDLVAMVILDDLAAVPLEAESVHMVLGGVGRDALLECDMRRRRLQDGLMVVLVLPLFRSCFENFDFTRGDGVQVIASHDVTGGKNSVSSAKEQGKCHTWTSTLGVRRQRRTQGWRR